MTIIRRCQDSDAYEFTWLTPARNKVLVRIEAESFQAAETDSAKLAVIVLALDKAMRAVGAGRLCSP